ncbi:beta-defensin 114 [Choloepus didactylus]|uniref:beta-defensin 114 n=1 Tax=Choloepus didactylus TaxID=27675 RepID=UPI00189FB475|nr:beta-defensin 114 [Choloepus didactylus]
MDKVVYMRPLINQENNKEISNFTHSSFTVATCTLMDANRCSARNGRCRKNCAKNEKQVDICFSPSKICCAERLYEEDFLF